MYKKLLPFLAILLIMVLAWKFNLNKTINIPWVLSEPSPTPFPSPLPTTFTVSKQLLKWGAFTGDSVNDSIDFHQKLGGRQLNYLPTFVHWGNENQFPYQFAEYAVLENQTIVIYWEAMDYNNPHPETDSRFSYDQILSGKYDAYIKSFAASLKNYSRPVILIPFEEMNGNWYPWSVTKNGNTPAKHIAAYRYVHQFFNNAPNVKFGWTINNDNVPDTVENQPLTYYPGDKYVDYVGINGFNFGDPWQSFSDVFFAPLASLQKINKPLIIFSMGSAEGPQKATWIKDAADLISKDNQVVGWIWFNQNKERDWRVWSDPESLKAFQQFLLTASNKTPPRY